MRLTLLTCAAQPALTDDDRLVADALSRRGAAVHVSPWSTLNIDNPGDACVLRSTWDYHIAFARFCAWLDAMDWSGLPLVNPSALVRWNANKVYLRDLAAAGVALPATLWLDTPDDDNVAAAIADAGWERAVLKPCVSASAHGTIVVTPATRLSGDALAPLRAHGAMLQRFVPEIGHGELSVVFFEGVYSHAVLKRPREGDFRVHLEFGGIEQAAAPTPVELSFAERVLAGCPDVPAYARVDLVTTASGPVLMELELIEPVLFLASDPAAPERFARAILARL